LQKINYFAYLKPGKGKKPVIAWPIDFWIAKNYSKAEEGFLIKSKNILRD